MASTFTIQLCINVHSCSSDTYSLAYLVVISGTIPSLVWNRCMQSAGDRRAGLLLVTGIAAGLLLVTGGWPPVVDS